MACRLLLRQVTHYVQAHGKVRCSSFVFLCMVEVGPLIQVMSILTTQMSQPWSNDVVLCMWPSLRGLGPRVGRTTQVGLVDTPVGPICAFLLLYFLHATKYTPKLVGLIKISPTTIVVVMECTIFTSCWWWKNWNKSCQHKPIQWENIYAYMTMYRPTHATLLVVFMISSMEHHTCLQYNWALIHKNLSYKHITNVYDKTNTLLNT